MAEQAVGEAIEARGLHPVLFSVKLYERYPLEELPGDGLGQERTGLGLVLPHDEPHLGRTLPAPRATHALQEARDGERCVNLERPLQPANVHSQLQR